MGQLWAGASESWCIFSIEDPGEDKRPWGGGASVKEEPQLQSPPKLRLDGDASEKCSWSPLKATSVRRRDHMLELPAHPHR